LAGRFAACYNGGHRNAPPPSNKENRRMSTRLIELDDGVLIEIAADPGEAQQISSRAANHVSETLSSIEPLLVRVCRPVIGAWRELSREMQIDSAEIELGLSFEGEGNLYIARAKTSANFTVKLVLRPLDATQPEA